MTSSLENCKKMVFIKQKFGANFVPFLAPKNSKFEKQKTLGFFRMTSSIFVQNFR